MLEVLYSCQPSKPLVIYIHLLAIRALGNKLNNALLHTFPPIYFSQITVHLYGTQINGIYRAMSFFHDPLLDPIHHWYTQPTLLVQHIIYPLFKSQYSLFLNIYLQFKKKWGLGLVFLSPLTLVIIQPCLSTLFLLLCNL